MKIGITINLGSSLWSNGLNQNALFLAMVFEKLEHDVDLIYDGVNAGDALNQSMGVYSKIIKLQDALNLKYDVIISLGFFISKTVLNTFKKLNVNIKYVSYKCGNDFLTDTESLLFNAHSSRDDQNSLESIQNLAKPDNIWLIPQMENTNYDYYEFQTGQKNKTVVPFVWDPIFIENESSKIGLKKYTSKPIKNIGVFEPNISVFKHIIMPFVIVSKYIKSGGLLDGFHTFSTFHLKDHVIFKKLIHLSELKKTINITANNRFPINAILKKHVDLVLSWQWENPLNYLYLDVAWLGYPIIHNGHLCKDIGYYYEGFNADSGAAAIKLAIETHNQDLDYLNRMRSIIFRYTINNEELLSNYTILLDNLINDRFKTFRYDWKTNSIS